MHKIFCAALLGLAAAAMATTVHAEAQLAAASSDQILEALPPATPKDSYWELSSGFDSSRGNYGALDSTTISYVPVGLSYHDGAWAVAVDSGYIHIEGALNYVDIESLLSGGAPPSAPKTRRRGLADTSLSVKYALYENLVAGLFVDVGARLRTPTASVSKHLGTGHVAGDLSIDVTRALGKWTVFVGGEYGIRDARDVDRNPWSTTAGLARTLSERWSAGAFHSWRQSAVAGGEGSHEVFAYTAYRLTDHFALTLYGATGLSRASVGREIGMRYSYRWP